MAMYDGIDIDTLKRYMNRVLNAGNRAKDLVSQILSFSRRNEQEKNPVKISSIIKEALKLLRATLPSTIEIITNIQAESGIILADPTQIHQVIMNLCTNASHSMKEKGGTLEVKLMECTITDQDIRPDIEPGDYLKLIVSDTGHGMSPEIMEQIFDPFFTTKEKGEGTGLGLAVVHGIVKSHGGVISVYSEVGLGTAFTILFPRIVSDVVNKIQEKKVIPEGHSNILFVDDEESLVYLSKEMLEQIGHNVTTTVNSLDALELFKANPKDFDLVITDLTMPHMTGTDLAKEITRIRPDIPVILCTGFTNTAVHQNESSLAGICGVLRKPISIYELAKEIQKVTGKNG